MKKVLLFKKERFNYSELKEKTTEELFDLWSDNPTDSAFYDNMDDYQENLSNGDLSDMFAIFIDSCDIL